MTLDITQSPPSEAFEAAADIVQPNRDDVIYPVEPKFVVTYYDNAYNPLGEITDYLSATVTFKRNNVGTGTIVVKGNDPCVPYVLRATETVVPITVTVNGLRWSGRVDTWDDDIVDGLATVTLQLQSDWQWLFRMLVWPNPFLPIQIQFPKESIYIGPAVTCCEVMVFEQCIRLQLGLWEIVNNIFDPAAWFATAIEGAGLLTPVAVVPGNALTDTSKWVAVTARMVPAGTLIQQICKDNGVDARVELWLPGEPQPTDLYTLTEPTIVASFRDKSGVQGPTGTFLDGLIEVAFDLLNSVYQEVISPFINSPYAPPGVDLSAIFGIHYTKPWLVFMPDNPRSGVKECKTTGHHPLAHTVVGGGKSPSWVNKLIDTLLELLLSEILAALGASGIAPTLLDGILDDVFLAFQEIENAPRRFALGRYAYPEIFTSTGSTAYTLEELFALENQMWESRGYTTSQLTFYDGTPYSLGVDLNIGDLASWIRRGVLYTDYVEEATATDDRTKRVEVTAVVGDGKSKDSPFAILQRRLAGFEAAMQIALLSQN